MRAVVKLSCNDFKIRSELKISHKPSQPTPNDFMNTAESGISTIKDRYARVKPSERPKPGSTRDRCDMMTPQKRESLLKSISKFKTIFASLKGNG
jgi:hypothetical protein